MENNDKKFYLTIQGQKVEVSEDVYRAYVQPIRREQRRRRRDWRCPKLSETGGFFVRCKDKCEECPYYLAGNSPLGNVTSLDKLVDCEIEIEDNQSDLEANYIEHEIQKEEYAKLHTAIAALKPKYQKIIQMVYFDGKSQEEIAEHLGVKKQAISNVMQRIYGQLKNIFKNFS